MFLKAAPRPLGAGVLRERATGPAFRHGWPAAKCSSQQRPGPWGGCASGTGHGHCISSRLACGQMFLKAAPPALGAEVVQVRATGTAFRHGWPAAKFSSQQRPGPWGRACCGSGPRALRFVTVGLRPNVPHSSAPALGAGVLRVRATGTAFRHGWPSAKCSSKQRPGPWGRVRCECGPRALCFVTVGLRPNAPQSSAPRPVARGSASEFSTKNTPNVENPRKE